LITSHIMPWLPIYADEEDFQVIHDWLNQNDEIAFIVPDGPSRWRAVYTVARMDSPRICLWHVPSGPLPLRHPLPSKRIDPITDPWSGWTELRGRADHAYPYFGFYHVGVIWLERSPQRDGHADTIGLSSFGWTGNVHAKAGHPAPESTKKFWANLRSWTKKNAVKIPRSGSLDGPRPEIWAFPSALSAIKRGRNRANNP
jgi:hypothetical protein